MSKAKESKNRQVQIVQRESLVTAFKQKAESEHISMNEAANRAIAEYIETGGDNIVDEPSRRVMLLIPQSMHDKLTTMAKSQGISVNKAVDHALTAYITGKQTDNSTNRLVTYISASGTLRARVDSIVSVVNEKCGGITYLLSQMTDTVKEKMPLSKEPDRQKRMQEQINNISKDLNAMVDRVNDIWKEKSK